LIVRALLFALLGGVAACGGRTDLDLPVVELQASTIDGGADVDELAPTCSVTLSVTNVAITSGCWIDERVSHQNAVLRFPCIGGVAEADFGATFSGTVAEPSTATSLSASTTFWWSDGCRWQSEQRIEGELSAGALRYTYSEMPIQGTSCDPATCVGNADVEVQ
jgi:hypothetical protein